MPVRRPGARKTRISKTAQLEGKLDNLVSLLQTHHQGAAVAHHESDQAASWGPSPSHLPPGPSITTPDSESVGGPSVPSPIHVDAAASYSTTRPTPSYLTPPSHPSNTLPITAPSAPSVAEIVSRHHIQEEAAEEQLNTFRHVFLPFFPFVYVPEPVRAADLLVQKPFLWLLIMSLTTKSIAQQLSMCETIREVVARKAVADHDRSMDILLGLVCYLGWLVYISLPSSAHI